MKVVVGFIFGFTLMTCPILGAELKVRAGQSIQAAIKQAAAGDTIVIGGGVYEETLYIDKPNITLRGEVDKGQLPLLEGGGKLNDGIIVSGSGFVAERLRLRHYRGNGITTQGASNVVIRNLVVTDTGIYGIYPSLGKNIRIENNVVSGISDAGIYTGMCENVDIRNNELYANVAGIEVENSINVLVENNVTRDNTSGILIFALPGLATKKVENVIVRGNFILNNNHYNFAESGAIVANVPPGTGILLLAADNIIISDNIIRNNTTAGVIVADLLSVPNMVPDPEVDAYSDGIQILVNQMQSNGLRGVGDYIRWYHYIFKNLWAGQVPEDSMEQLLPPSSDIYVTDDKRAFDKIASRNCVWDLEAYKVLGAKSLLKCGSEAPTTTVTTMIQAPKSEDRVQVSTVGGAGAEVFNSVCVGCHAMQNRFIGPPIVEIQEKYRNNPEGIAAFAAKPKKVRADFPEMPSQNYMGKDKLVAVAKFILEKK